MRPFLLIICCWFCYSVAQNVPKQYGTKYFYKYNDTLYRKNAAIKPNKKTIDQLKQYGLLFVDSLSFSPEGQVGYDTIVNVTKSIKTPPFFIYRTEVSNLEYKEFFDSMKAPAYYPDTNVWLDPTGENSPFVHYYYQHHAYKNYPVVGITHWQAIQFCKWKTAKLNRELTKRGISEYTFEVALPTDAEFCAAYKQFIIGWLSTQKKTCSYGLGYSYIRFSVGCGQFRCNFHSITTQRLAEVKAPIDLTWGTYGFIVTPVISFQNTLGIYNLAGNVAEWTATPANGSLFNNLEYIYTTTNKIIPNTQTTIDNGALQSYLHDYEVMQKFYSVKGGAWNDELYYLQPLAQKFVAEYESSSSIGFRYVVRVHKK